MANDCLESKLLPSLCSAKALSGLVRPGRPAHQEVVGVMGLAILMAKEGWSPCWPAPQGLHVSQTSFSWAPGKRDWIDPQSTS